LALNHQALTQKCASSKKPQVENEKFAMRTYLNRIGLIGDEFKNCREHLCKHLDGKRGVAVSGGIDERTLGADSRPLSRGKRKEGDANGQGKRDNLSGIRKQPELEADGMPLSDGEGYGEREALRAIGCCSGAAMAAQWRR
jgi:hypothetical protein